MLKKIIGTIAGSALVLSGLVASPANAATPADVPFVSFDNLGDSSLYVNYGYTNGFVGAENNITITEGSSTQIQANTGIQLNKPFVDANRGKKLEFTAILKDPNGNEIKALGSGGEFEGFMGGSQIMNGTIQTTDNGRYYFGTNIFNQPTAGYSNVPGNDFTIPADGGKINGIFASGFTNINYKGLQFGKTIPAGTYTVIPKWTIDGVEIVKNDAAGVSQLSTSVTSNVVSASPKVPSLNQGTISNIGGIVLGCVDSDKVAVGDRLMAEGYIDGQKATMGGMTGNVNTNGRWMTRSRANTTSPDYRTGGVGAFSTATVTAFDKTDGLGFWFDFAMAQQNAWAVGSSHTMAIKIYNQDTNTDVSGSCLPGRTGVPTISYDNATGDMKVTVTGSKFATSSYCVLYDKAAPTKIAGFASTLSALNGGPLTGTDNGTCTFKKELLKAGHVYEVNTFSGFQRRYGYAQGVTTDGSKPALIGAGGSSSGSGIVGTTAQSVTFNGANNAGLAYLGSTGLKVSGTVTTGVALSYSSSTPSVCTVDETTGKVTAIAVGDCTITASNRGDETYAPFSKTVTFAITAAATGTTTQTSNFSAPSNTSLAYVGSTGLTVAATTNSLAPLAYTSSTPSVCTVDAATGKVTALAVGDCSITATSGGDGTYAPFTKTVTFPITAPASGTTAQTFTVNAPTNMSVNLEGFDLVAKASSGLAITYTSSTTDVCTIDAAGHLTTLKAGTCKITVTQPGDSTYAPSSQEFTYEIAGAATTEVAVADDAAKPLTLGASGTITSRESIFTWKRSTGTFGYKIKILYIGPVKATASWKVGSKKYSCVVNFGLLKKQSSAKLLTLTSPNFCTGKTEKAQLAALKKIPKNTVVTVVINRTWYTPTTYTKIRPWKRTTYVKLG